MLIVVQTSVGASVVRGVDHQAEFSLEKCRI